MSMRALLIEDSDDHADLSLRVMRRLDLKPTRAADLSGALSLLQAGGFDVVITDLDLPDSPREQTVRSVRGACAGLPLVVLSTMEDAESRRGAFASGAQAFLTKSELTLERLGRVVREAIVAASADRRIAPDASDPDAAA